MLTDIIDCNQNLFKLPLFYLINTYCQKPQTNKISYHELTNFVYLYYVNVYYSLKWEEQIPFSSMTIKNVNKYEFSKQDFLRGLNRTIIGQILYGSAIVNRNAPPPIPN